MQADTASTQFGVDGTGVTLGVISDSVSQYAGGLPDSYKSGDLSASNPVNVLLDGPAGSTDEGRAMLENVHDVAPGASLAFSTGDGGDTVFAQSILNLATEAKSQIIADDLSYLDEPFFQPGIIGSAVEQVVSQNNVSYFGAAGNTGPDEGYLSAFRGVNATVTGVGTGTFMNFNPNGQQTTLLPVTTANGSNGFPISASNPATIVFQFDQPWYTANGVTSQLNFYILSSTGTIVASGTNDNTATQQPIQSVAVPTAGNYFVAIQLVKGPAPNYVEFLNYNENATFTVSTQFGAAGSTYYPSSSGHHVDPSNIGVGAMPWWGAEPWLNVSQINSESFSSPGPGLFDINSSGQFITPIITQDPAITAPDGGNTSFFSPGNIINTTNTPPFAPGEPSTPTNLSQDLPSFFGTSSATPNAAAVAALMKELVPQATEKQIETAVEERHADERDGGGHLELAIRLRACQRG